MASQDTPARGRRSPPGGEPVQPHHREREERQRDANEVGEDGVEGREPDHNGNIDENTDSVLVLADTSTTMTLHVADDNPAWGDGSTLYSDVNMTRGLTQTPGFGLYTGTQTATPAVCPPSSPPTVLSAYDGLNSRLYAVKSALTDALNATQQVDWGLLRFAGSSCPVVNTKTSTPTLCVNDSGCPAGLFCISGTCNTNNNLCASSTAYDQACHSVGSTALTWSGSCGTTATAGSPACATPQACLADSDCTGARSGQCALLVAGPVRTCGCLSGAECPSGYICTAGRCTYNLSCVNPGGSVLVDPASGTPYTQALPWLDGLEMPGANPELRANGNAPLAGATRSAAAWYNNIKLNNLDPQILCRPYVLVLVTDGLDTCGENTAGMAAAASSFVAATANFARRANRVYVVAVSLNGTPSAPLDAMAAAGGTGSAHLANNAAEIEAALVNIAQTTSLIEKCNNADDDCNNVCDEPFPGVALSGACGSRAAASCTNGAPSLSRCFATGATICSADGLSQKCSAPTCQTNPNLCPAPESSSGCNAFDDDCNGFIDDCTTGVENSCCN